MVLGTVSSAYPLSNVYDIVKSIAEMGAYVSLIEYNNIEGSADPNFFLSLIMTRNDLTVRAIKKTYPVY